MDLFTETLANYLKTEWHDIMTNPEGVKEARFIVESLDPFSTFELFSALEEYRLQALQNQRLECHFKVARNLWDDWCKREDKQALLKTMIAKNAVDVNANHQLKWIDEEDRLTWYRNRTLAPDKDGLVVVLLGFNHASDQGGLANFHLVDEQRLWNQMEQSFQPWILRINEKLSLEATDQEIDRFDNALQQLFKVRPRSLVKLANFFEREIFKYQQDFSSLSEVIEHFYKALPFWGIPALFTVNKKNASVITDAKKITEAEKFISYQRFKTPSQQNKDWEKIEKALTDPDKEFEIPETLNGEVLYPDLTAYQNTLHDFIFKADTKAKNKLLQTDLSPILDILKRPASSSGSGTDKLFRLSGFGLEVILQAIWDSLLKFEHNCSGRPLAEVITGIAVVFKRFNHDLEDNKEEGVASDVLATELLNGCLGGLAELLAEIDIRLPVDSDQALLHRDHWEVGVPIALDLGLSYGKSKSAPHLLFQIEIQICEELDKTQPYQFRWDFPSTHAERVRLLAAREVLEQWQPFIANGRIMLPAFQMPDNVMTALYFAADEEEASRLLTQGFCSMKIVNLVADVEREHIPPPIWNDLKVLSEKYRHWLKSYSEEGYYHAIRHHFPCFQTAYENFAETVLDRKITGSLELLRRFYKAFLLVDEQMTPNDHYLHSAVVWGISPPVLELTLARECFLRDSFPEIIANHLRRQNGKKALSRLLNLVEIHRPLAGLVVDAEKKLSAEIKSFGLVHYLGAPPATDKSLAVQTLLREEEIDDDENISDIVRETEESDVVVRVLEDYVRLYPFAEDGLRILAVHVEDLRIILAGVDKFLKNYLVQTSTDYPAFHCEVMVYSTSSSPLAVESRLTAWRDHVMEAYREKGRSLLLSVAHHFAPSREKMVTLLEKEARLYDVGFLFRFLAGGLRGVAKSTEPFKLFDNLKKNSISQFPICEYPRPIQKGDSLSRETLLSNRRLRIQTRHADLSARLRNPDSSDCDHLILGEINYEPWQKVVKVMHNKAQWLACIDPFVDKRLLASNETNGMRKIVGFTSGLGAYGELNLSVSTEMDTLSQLSDKIKNHLAGLLPFQCATDFEAMAAKIVAESEEIIGLGSLRAVVGKGEKIREVIGFSAIRRTLIKPNTEISQLLPVDSLLHWFDDSEVNQRPDLLQLSLVMRENDIPLIEAVLIECKFAQHNVSHLNKANDQIQDGLKHLTQLFIPNRTDINRVSFDRRYWWAQLQRAITSRSVVSMPAEQQRKKLDVALEQLAEGYYEITWQAAIFTFWTDDTNTEIETTAISLPRDIVLPPLHVPDDFKVWHIAMGCQKLISLFKNETEANNLELANSVIWVRPENANVFTKTESLDSPKLIKTIEVTETFNADPTPPPEAEIFTTTVEIKPETLAMTQNTESENDEEIVTETKSSEPESKIPVSFGNVPPDKILIGTKSNGEPVYWHYGHPQLANRHLLLFGASGSGKTYGIQCLLAEMAKQGMRSLIIDYTDGFLPQQIETGFSDASNPQNHFVITDKLPLNPFRKQQQIIDPSIPAIEENPYQVAARVSSIFTSVFNTMGDQQSSALIRVLETGIAEDAKFSLSSLLARLRDDSQYGETLANKLEPFIRAEPFREGADSAWEQMLTSPKHSVHVLQLKGLAREIQKLVTEFALWDLYDYACNTGSKNRPIPIVLDEIQNLDHRSDSPIDKMLREGRKFGLSLILATQTTSQFDQEQRDRLFQAGHKLFFKPADTEIDRFAGILSLSTSESKATWAERLSKLQKGQCWSLGYALTSSGNLKNTATLVTITALENRDFTG